MMLIGGMIVADRSYNFCGKSTIILIQHIILMKKTIFLRHLISDQRIFIFFDPMNNMIRFLDRFTELSKVLQKNLKNKTVKITQNNKISCRNWQSVRAIGTNTSLGMVSKPSTMLNNYPIS